MPVRPDAPRALLAVGASAALVGGLLVVLAPPAAAPAASGVGPDGSAVRPHRAAGARPPLRDVRVRFVRTVRGLRQPTAVTAPRDGSGRVLVAERAGLVRVVRGGRLRARPYLDLRDRVATAGSEQGLLGLAFRPGFRRHRELYVSYTARSGALRVSRFVAPRPRAARLDPAGEQVVLTVPHPGATNHNGGGLAFQRGGLLLVSTGDGGGAGDPGDDAQRLDSLLGKVLRVDVSRGCGGRRYCVPSSNPFAGRAGARGEVWAYGLRNPWRVSYDRPTRTLWVGDVGQDRFEEVDRLPDRAAGANLGWSCREGRRVHDASRCRPGASYREPVFVYGRSAGRSVVGGTVYRGRAHARLLRGRYLFTDFFSGTVWAHAPRTGRTRVVGRFPSGAMITALGVVGRGEVAAVGYDGSLWRMRARRR